MIDESVEIEGRIIRITAIRTNRDITNGSDSTQTITSLLIGIPEKGYQSINFHGQVLQDSIGSNVYYRMKRTVPNDEDPQAIRVEQLLVDKDKNRRYESNLALHDMSSGMLTDAGKALVMTPRESAVSESIL